MTSYKGGTDEAHRVALKSQIVWAHWKESSACAGEPVAFEVQTAFVGDGAEATLEFRTRSGKTVDRIPGKILRNELVGSFLIPESANEELYFEAKLKKHGLQARSNTLVVFPLRNVTNARWDRGETTSGEEVQLLADTSNVPDGTRVTLVIYEEDAGGGHVEVARFGTEVRASKIEAVWSFQFPEDVEDIPVHGEGECGYIQPKYFFEARVGRRWARSGLLKFKDWVEFHFEDFTGKEEYVVHRPDGSEKRGKFDAEGKVRFERDFPGRYSLEVVFPS